MKRTDMERRTRELKRIEKRDRSKDRREDEREGRSIGDFIKAFVELFIHTEEQIFNILKDERILDLVIELREELPEDKWEVVFRKAVRKTKVKKQKEAVEELCTMLD
jgi:hypothetical protein